MAEIIRQDVVAIRFDVESGPMGSIVKMMEAVLGSVNRMVAGAESGLAGVGAAADAAAAGMGGMVSAVHSAGMAFEQMGGSIGDFARMASELDNTGDKAQAASVQIRAMAASLRDAAAEKVESIVEGLHSSATAAKDFAVSLKANTFDKAVAGAQQLYNAMGRLTMGDTVGMGKLADDIDLGLGKGMTAVRGFVSKLREAKGAEQGVGDGADGAAENIRKMGDAGSKSGGALSSIFAKVAGGVELLKAGMQAVGDVIGQSMGPAMDSIDSKEQFGRVLEAMPAVSSAAEAAGMSVQDMTAQIGADTTAIVTDTAFGLTTAMQGVQGQIAGGIDPSQATANVQAIADAVAFYTDGTDASFAQVNEAFTKMAATGSASADELQAVAQAGIPVYDIYADAVGKSVDQVQQELGSGAVGADEFMATLTTAMEGGTAQFPALAGAAQEAGASWSGTFDNMQAAVARGTESIITGLDGMLAGGNLPGMRDMLGDMGRSFGDLMGVMSGAGDPGEFFATLQDRLTGMPEALATMGQGIGDMFSRLGEMAPQLGEMLGPLMEGLGTALASALGGIVQAAAGLLPQLLLLALDLIMALADGLIEQLPVLIPVAMQAVLTLVQGLMDRLPMLIASAIMLVLMLVQGLMDSLPMLINAAITLVMGLLTGLIDNLPLLIVAGIQIVIALIVGLIDAIPTLIEMIPEIFVQVVDAIISIDWLDVGVQILQAIWDGIKSIGSSIWNGIKDLFTGGDGGDVVADVAPDIAVDTTGATAAGQQTADAYGTGLSSGLDNIEPPNLSDMQLPDISELTAGATEGAASLDRLGGSAATVETMMANISTGTSAASADMGALNTATGEAATGMGLSLDTLSTKTGETQVAMGAKMDAILADVRALAMGVQTALDALATALFTSGVNAMEGFNNGMESMRERVLETARSIAQSVTDTINAALDVNSPSRVTMVTGRSVGEGIVVGMAESLPAVRQEASSMAMAAVPGTAALAPRTPETSPAAGGGGSSYVTNNNTPQFNLTIGGNATGGDREMERKVKRWVMESFERVMANAERGAPTPREA